MGIGMTESKSKMKTVWLRFWNFFCTRVPVISLAGIGFCWLVYFLFPRGSTDIGAYSKSFWNAMGVIVWLTMIFGALFVLSLICYLFHRPLPEKRKWLHVILRILIAIAAVFVTCNGVYLSIFIFALMGY
jgi:hypothetical protein